MRKTRLQLWMDKKGWNDGDVARAVKTISRVQINRIRRGVSGARLSTAMQLQALTNIRWWNFMKQPTQARKSAGRRKARE